MSLASGLGESKVRIESIFRDMQVEVGLSEGPGKRAPQRGRASLETEQTQGKTSPGGELGGGEGRGVSTLDLKQTSSFRSFVKRRERGLAERRSPSPLLDGSPCDSARLSEGGSHVGQTMRLGSLKYFIHFPACPADDSKGGRGSAHRGYIADPSPPGAPRRVDELRRGGRRGLAQSKASGESNLGRARREGAVPGSAADATRRVGHLLERERGDGGHGDEGIWSAVRSWIVTGMSWQIDLRMIFTHAHFQMIPCTQ